VDVIETESSADFIGRVREAKAKSCRTMAAMGGDGTLQMLAQEVMFSDVKVGVIPAGGGNDFAAALGISKEPDEAVAAIVKGTTRQVDLVGLKFGNGDQRIYLGGGGMGLDAEAAREANGRFAKWPGRIRYLASAITALRRFEGIEIDAEFPAEAPPRIRRRVLLAVILNTPTFGGGVRLAPEAKIDDGKLTMVLLATLSKLDVLTLIPRLLITGELKTQKAFRVETTSVKLSAAGAPWFQGDGELLGHAPVEIKVLPGALQMIVP
jgi:diacylglycerol kinase (ATP)